VGILHAHVPSGTEGVAIRFETDQGLN
jgi:hypothetical protein